MINNEENKLYIKIIFKKIFEISQSKYTLLISKFSITISKSLQIFVEFGTFWELYLENGSEIDYRTLISMNHI